MGREEKKRERGEKRRKRERDRGNDGWILALKPTEGIEPSHKD